MDVNTRVVERLRDPEFPDVVVELIEETQPGYPDQRPEFGWWLYGIGRGWEIKVWQRATLIFSWSYFGDEDGRERARSDAKSFARLELPPGFFENRLTFNEVRFDGPKAHVELRAIPAAERVDAVGPLGSRPDPRARQYRVMADAVEVGTAAKVYDSGAWMWVYFPHADDVDSAASRTLREFRQALAEHLNGKTAATVKS
tara:strand:- start:239 stop:838 length:600 start_codon:yes stop_codon:yes gene_type:complete